MDSALFLVLRRMRTPLIVVIASYAISSLGFVLIPGVDPEGRPWQMSFFHAFYILSYTATTIGFGEVPHPFTNAQRLWMIFSIYLTVIAWFYAVGKILQLMQDPAFRQVVRAGAFTRSVRRLQAPFYIVCGYGETGTELVDAFDHRGVQTVVVDIDPARVAEAELGDLALDVLALEADVRRPETLVAAGLLHPKCLGIVALTNDDRANLAVAAAAKLLRPELRVVCRCEEADIAVNMASFGTDHIVNPFKLFGAHLAQAARAPGHYLLREWLSAAPDELLQEPQFPPTGNWVLCGFGRFGREIARGLATEGNFLSVVESDPEVETPLHAVCGRGTEMGVLERAGIREAVGIVAGTPEDVNNLSIIKMARQLNPGIFTVIRQNQRANAMLVDAVKASFVVQPTMVVVHACLAYLMAPMLARFLEAAAARDNDWANELLARIAGIMGDRVPESWAVHVTLQAVPALARGAASDAVPVSALLVDPRDRQEALPVIALAIERDGRLEVLPAETERIRIGDRILFCGRGRGRRAQQHVFANDNVLRYVLTGKDVPGGWVWQRLTAASRREEAIHHQL